MRKITLKHSLPARLAKHFSADLNESQREAVTAPDGYNLILAGPGSGKTRVITYRVAYLIARGVPADSILLVTFTRRAAREMVHRLETPDRATTAGKVWAGTFHHIGNRLLRRPARLLGYQPNFTILDSEDQLDLIRLAMEDAGLFGTGQAGAQARRGRAPDQLCAQYQAGPRRGRRRRSPRAGRVAAQIEAGGRGLREAQAALPIAWIMTTCSTQWVRLLARVSRAARAAGAACSGTS